MIEQQVINGRRATVTYIRGDWSPGTKEDYDFAKVFFEDGEVVYLTRPKPSDPIEVTAEVTPRDPLVGGYASARDGFIPEE